MSMNSINTTPYSKEVLHQNTMNNITTIDTIDKSKINAFKANNNHAYHHNIFKRSVAVWKYTANLTGPSNVKYNRNNYVNYYNMQDIAAYLDNNYSKVLKNYKKRIKRVELGFMSVPVYKHYTYINKYGHYRTVSRFQGYSVMIGFIKGHKLIDFYTGVHHNLLGKKVDYYITFSNFHDFNNYLVKEGHQHVSYKDFKEFLLQNKVDCRKKPNPNNKYEMQESRKTDVIIAKLRRQDQHKYNKQDPTALQLRKLAKQHEYNDFLTTMLGQYKTINKRCLVEETRSHVYFDDVFHMPKHLIDWLKLKNK